jgi:glycosyltransferase involved in cell wall biosynthesis/O-antigen/teichoic acid export membrane protein
LGIAAVRRSGVAAWSSLSSGTLREFWHQTALLLAVLGVMNASNYVFHVVMSRMLGPSDYGALAALLAVVLVVSIPLGVIQTAVAEKTAKLRSVGRGDEVGPLALTTLKGATSLAYAAGLVAALVLTPLLSVFLHVDLLSALLLAPYVVASVPASVAQGVLQGERRMKALSAVQLTATLLRLVFGIVLVSAGLGVTGAVLATAASAVVTVPIAFRMLEIGRDAWGRARRSLAGIRGDVAPALFGLTSFWLLAEADIALARHYLDGEASGFYSSASVIARALLFLPSAVAIVAFPRFVAARADREQQLWWLRTSAVAVGVLAAFGFVGLFFLRDPLIRIAFGDSYSAAADLLPILAVAMAWLAVVNVLVFFHIALASRAYLISLAGVALEAILIWRFHDSAEQVALVVCATSALVAFLQYVSAGSIVRWQRPERSHLPATPLALEPTLELSVVLPCHNAGAGLRSVLTSLLAHLEPTRSFEIIVVSDGSTDDTVEIARSLESRGVRVIECATQGGKGQALQVGLSEARGKYVAFCDADGDIAADAIEPFLTLMRLYDPDVILGSKRHPLSDVYYPPLRRLLSWTYHKITRVLFRINVRDTQTGFKLIRRDVLAAVLPRLYEKRYAFDLEFLVVARTLGFTRVLEAPVRIHYRFASQVNLASSAGILQDTLAIFYRHQILDSYRRAGPAAEGSVAPAASRDGSRRILIINWRDLAHPDAGGAEVFTHEVARRWAEQGHDVTQLSSGFAGAPKSDEVDGVRLRRLGRLRTGSFHALVQRELARLRGYDAVVESVNTIPFLTPLWRGRVPHTLAVFMQLAEDVWDAELPRPLAAVGRRIERALLRLYRDVPTAAISPSTRADLQRLGFTRVTDVPVGLDEAPDVRHVPKALDPTFLFVGRLAANKRPEHAVQAFRVIRGAMPGARLWIVGRGPVETELARALPEGAELLGRLPRAELFERMAAAHCLIVPSVREGWGLVVVEANSVGTPAVGYDIPGLRDSIRHGTTGRLAPNGDVDALADAALAVVADADGYEQMQAAARAWAASFSWDETATTLYALLMDSASRTFPESLADPAAAQARAR